MSNPRAVIFGCQSTQLLDVERDFFQRTNPLGFILFARNCETPEQIQQLVHDLRKAVDRSDAPVLIDQEGGRVARLKGACWRAAPPLRTFGLLAEEDAEEASWCVRANAWLMGKELQALGVSVNCAPVVDVLHETTHAIIGDRAFGDNPDLVATLALQAIKGFQEANIVPVIKHIPGHGRATVDSHESLPVVEASLEELYATDFKAFQQVCRYFQRQTDRMPWAMTAHVIYNCVDTTAPATQSASLIDSVIREHIGFSGFLLSDCLTMKALKGNLGIRAKKSLDAGCDAVLHCSGSLEEMIEVMTGTAPLKDESLNRLRQSLFYTDPPLFASVEETLKRLNQTLNLEGFSGLAEGIKM
jgi:beta-N-acetylhexosaminidase